MGMRAFKTALLGSVSVIGLTVMIAPVMAQDAPEEGVVGDYLGEIDLSSSKREVQTQTAESVTEIGQEEIDDRQAATVAELIDTVPGVTLVNGTTPQSSG
ncbi:TonB-dependent receptor plug domain-containing protein, partial [Cribrihabitans sp. XS_ASV171]